MVRERFKEVIVNISQILLLHLAHVYKGVSQLDQRTSDLSLISNLGSWDTRLNLEDQVRHKNSISLVVGVLFYLIVMEITVLAGYASS